MLNKPNVLAKIWNLNSSPPSFFLQQNLKFTNDISFIIQQN